MKPMRILQVVTQLNRGGLETMLMNFYRHVDREKIQFDFLKHRREKGDYDDEVLSMGGRIYHTYPIHPRFFIKYLADLDSFFAEHSAYKIVHSHIDALSAFPLRAAKKAGVSVRIAHSHTTDFDNNFLLPFRYLAKGMIHGAATHYFACTQNALRFMFGNSVYTSERYTILNNAIDTQRFRFNQETRARVRNELGLADKLVLGHVGSMSYPKNHGFMLDIFNEVHKRQCNAVLLLVGDGPDREKIEQMAASLGLSGVVKFLGVREDVPDLMQAMDVFVFPSRFEGLGIVAVEAQAAGLPVLASDKVPTETAVTELIHYLSLADSSATWAEAVSAQIVTQRIDTTAQIKRHDYDITDSAKLLEFFYLNAVTE